RVKVEGNDEVARLARSFNRAAERIEELVSAHKSLLANASHELRTPLTRIRMAAELVKENVDPKRKRESEQDVCERDALIAESRPFCQSRNGVRARSVTELPIGRGRTAR